MMNSLIGSLNENERTGTQTLERAIAILREIANRGHLGWQLSDLAARCQLSKSTTHRILMCLVRERMVRQSPGDRLYLPGPMLFELGLTSSPERGEFQHIARNRLAALARLTSGVCFLFFRSGDDLVCAIRAGTARLEAKALAILPGTRKPLIVAAGGVSILLALPRDEAEAIVERNFANLTDYSDASIAGVRRMIDNSFVSGEAVNASNIIPGVSAFGVAIRDADGNPFASVALAGSERRFPMQRAEEITGMLKSIASEMESLPS